MSKMKRTLAFLICLLLVIAALPINSMYTEAKTVKVKSIKLNKTTYTLKKNKTVKLSVTFNPKNTSQKKLIWSSSNKKIATVDKKGKVKAKKNGNATITVKVKGTKKKATCKIYVGTPVTNVSLNAKSKTLTVGEKYQLTAKLTPAKPTVKGVTYTTSNKKIATVTSGGLVSAMGEGKCTITATAKDGTGKKAVISIVVNKKPVPKDDEPDAEDNTDTKPDTPTEPTDDDKIKEVTWNDKYIGEYYLGAYYDKSKVASGVVELELMGESKEVPDADKWMSKNDFPDGTKIEGSDDPENKYDQIVTVTGKSGAQCIYNVTYYYVDITSISMGKNGENTITEYWFDEYPPVADGDWAHLLLIKGYSERITSDFHVTLNRDDANIKVVDSKSNVKNKDLLITIGNVTGKYSLRYTNSVYAKYTGYLNNNFEYKTTTVKQDDGYIEEVNILGSDAGISQEELDKLNTTLSIQGKDETMSAEAKVVDSDRPDYWKMVTINCNNVITHIYLKYSIADKYFDLSSVEATKDGNNLINTWHKYYGKEFALGEKDSIIKIEGFFGDLPENISVATKYEEAQAVIVDSDRGEFTKMVIVTYKGESRKCYLLYLFDIDAFLDFHLSAEAIEGERNLITYMFADSESYGGEYIDYLTIRGRKPDLPSNTSFTTDIPDVEMKVVDSDIPDYKIMLLVKAGSQSYNAYIDYQLDAYDFTENLEFEAFKDGENLITKKYGDSWKGVIQLSGKSYNLPDNLTVKTDLPDTKVEIKNSDNAQYQKMLVATIGSSIKNLYITYQFDLEACITIEEHIDGNNIIESWYAGRDDYYDPDSKKWVDFDSVKLETESSDFSWNIEVNSIASHVTVKIEDSDFPNIEDSELSEYKKMLVVTVGDIVKKYYIKYYGYDY